MGILMDSGLITSVVGGLVVGLLLGGCLVAVVYQVIARTRASTFQEDLQRQLDGAKKTEADRFRRGQGAFLRNIRNEGIPL